MKITDEHVLPCDFIVGHIRFRKGIRLETVRLAAERWHKAAAEQFAVPASHDATRTMMTRVTALVDLDHTIFASWPRDGLINGCGGWDAYHSASVNDDIIHDTVNLVNALYAQGWIIIGLTARPEKWRSLSMKKLVDHNVKMDELLMRPDEAFHPAPEMKIQLAMERFGNVETMKDEVAFLIEDRDDVCEAFHALGITTLQVKGRQND